MERRGVFWAIVMTFLVVLAYVVPYTILSGVVVWYGSFLFWTAFGLASIAAIWTMTVKWRD